MPSFGTKSREKLHELDHELRHILEAAILEVDFSVIWTYRDKEQQNIENEAGRSKLRYPNSKHNRKPAKAFDIIPYPWGYEANYKQFFEMATYVLAAASKRGVKLRWGGHWKNFTGHGEYDRDWAHFEEIL